MRRTRPPKCLPVAPQPNPPPAHLPNIFGRRATQILAFFALNPEASSKQAHEALGVPYDMITATCRRLVRLGVLLQLPDPKRARTNYYALNDGLALSKWLKPFLRKMARHYGIPEVEREVVRARRRGRAELPRRGDYVKRGFEPVKASIPLALINGASSRARILLLIAAVQECYPAEINDVLGMAGAERHCREAVQQGILQMRRIWKIRAYSLNPHFPGAEEFRTFLRRWSVREPGIVAAGNAILLHRIGVERRTPVREGWMFDDLWESGRMGYVRGIVRWRRPASLWKELHGKFGRKGLQRSRSRGSRKKIEVRMVGCDPHRS